MQILRSGLKPSSNSSPTPGWSRNWRAEYITHGLKRRESHVEMDIGEQYGNSSSLETSFRCIQSNPHCPTTTAALPTIRFMDDELSRPSKLDFAMPMHYLSFWYFWKRRAWMTRQALPIANKRKSSTFAVFGIGRIWPTTRVDCTDNRVFPKPVRFKWGIDHGAYSFWHCNERRILKSLGVSSRSFNAPTNLASQGYEAVAHLILSNIELLSTSMKEVRRLNLDELWTKPIGTETLKGRERRSFTTAIHGSWWIDLHQMMYKFVLFPDA